MKQLLHSSLSCHAVTKFQKSITSKPQLIFLSGFFLVVGKVILYKIAKTSLPGIKEKYL